MTAKHRWIALIVLGLGFAVVDLFLPVVIDSAVFSIPPVIFALITGFGFGLVIGQVGLIVMWSILGRQSLFTRLLGSFLLLVLVWYALLTGFGISDLSPIDFDLAVAIGWPLLQGYLLFQGLLWLMRGVRGWRIFNLTEVHHSPGNASIQFGIRHLLVGTTAVAIAIAVGKSLITTSAWNIYFDSWEIFVIAFYEALITIVLLPLALTCVWAALNETHTTKDAAAIIGGVGLGMAFFEIILFAILSGGGPEETIVAIFALNVGQITAMFGTLMLFCAWGYRLTRRSAEPPNPELVRFVDE